MKDKWDFVHIVQDEANKFAEANKRVDLNMNICLKQDSMGYYRAEII